MFGNRLVGTALGLALGLAATLVACDGDPAHPDGRREGDVAELRGTVVLETGAGLAGATVELARGGVVPRSAVTDGKGRYSIGVPETGTWELRLRPPVGYALPQDAPRTMSVEVVADEVVTVDSAAVHNLTVEVNAHTPLDSMGVAGVRVRVIPEGESEPAATGTTGPVAGGYGGSAFFAMQPGVYDVLIDIPDGYALSPAFTNPQRVVVVADGAAWVGFGLQREE
ncbi:MAG TPA: carboxypeptidase-like regulatory domain-containing protein [Longimicrobiales bacterium]